MDNLTSDNYKEQIDILYKVNNIIREKSELYYDFISSLLTLINDTYLGSDVIQSEEDMFNHFDWCFNRITSNFEQERIYFLTKNTHHAYLWFFFYKGYYTCDNEEKYSILLEYFNILFNYNKIKTMPEVEAFIEFYKIFDQNLKKIN
jgi:hypothetical protein